MTLMALHFLAIALISINILRSCATTNDNASVVYPAEWHALLDLKARITTSTHTSDVLLRAWNANNSHNICKSWTGVICTRSGRHIAGINLAGFGLAGSLSPHLGNLTFISTLNLSSNQFSGGIPPQLSTCSSLQVLDLNGNNLTGPIPPSLGSLSSLQVLRLCNNSLSGPIPPPLFTNCSSLLELSLCMNALMGSIPASNYGWHLPRLQYLLLSDNHLTGAIPRSLGNCSNLEDLKLDSNHLLGNIPNELSLLSELKDLRLSENRLTGAIPSSLVKCKKLLYLDLSSNALTGKIPSEMGNLASIIELQLYNNNLTGVIPHSLGNCSKLESLSLHSNHLSGSIPQELGTCTNLLGLYLSNNTLSGKIPQELGSLTNLEELHLNRNSLNGGIPHRMGNCTKLLILLLLQNQLSGPIPKELGNLAYLQRLRLMENKLTGIPSALANCTQLTILGVSSNQLTGFFPNELTKLKHLQHIYLNNNHLEGTLISSSFSNSTASLISINLQSNLLGGPIPGEFVLQGLQFLRLDSNHFSGVIPWESLCNVTSLSYLGMSYNNLTGSLTSQLPRLSKLQYLFLQHNFLQGSIPDFESSTTSSLLQVDLSFNQLNGTLPDSLGNVLKNIIAFNVSNNGLSGVLPQWLGELMMVQEMHLSHNHFFGSIPESLSDCKELLYLDLSENKLVGEIPPQLGDMSSLTEMDLSNNHLTGMLPSTLAQLQYLHFLNVSFNNLEGPIPVSGVFKHLDARSFEGNPGLCSQLIHKPCNIHHHAQLAHWKRNILIVLASLVITTALIAFSFCTYRYSKHRQADSATQKFKIPGKTLRRFSAVELFESTDSYSNINLLGEGALSEVYKGVLPSGEMFAVKKFRNLGPYAREALLQEVHIMNKIRHRNLVKVLGYALDSEVHAIVLEFMPNGTLEKYLQECKNSHTLSLTVIVKIAQGVANALEYLHHEYDVASIIHGDVKPSNILLNSDFEACLADFGLAKHTEGDMGKVTLSSDIKGSLGYMAPEFAYAIKITPKVDLYSFGVVVLEMLFGMEPTHELLHGVTLHEWVKHKFLLEDGLQVRETVHPSLLLGSSSNGFDEFIFRVLLQMAMACTEPLPNKRPTMHDTKEFLDSLPIL